MVGVPMWVCDYACSMRDIQVMTFVTLAVVRGLWVRGLWFAPTSRTPASSLVRMQLWAPSCVCFDGV